VRQTISLFNCIKINSHRGHREHGEMIIFSVFSVTSVAKSLLLQSIPGYRGGAVVNDQV
jgi:hypothetical protein